MTGRRFSDQKEVLQMSRYKHFIYQERVELARMHHQGASISTMVELLGRCRSSIEREIARNGNKDGTYNPDTAQRRYEARRKRGSILDKITELGEFVVDMLQPDRIDLRDQYYHTGQEIPANCCADGHSFI